MSTRDLEKTQGCYSFQLVDIHGNFNARGLGDFERDTRLREQGDSYVVTSIMGPQGSGKSTLLNHLYGTNFKSRDPTKVGGKTTDGIWMARSRMEEQMIITLDVEGTDGKERGEDDNFERQSACFALAVSDIIMFNMKYDCIDKHNAGSIPLLTTMFKVMMEKLSTESRQKILMFVIRDKNINASDADIKSSVIENIKEVWISAQGQRAQESKPLDHFFKVEVLALSHYDHQNEAFKKEVDDFRKRSSTDVKGIRAALPASTFSEYLQTTWEDVKKNEALNLPSLRVLLADSHCSRIHDEVYQSFLADEPTWGGVDNNMMDLLKCILEKHLESFDEKTKYYDQEVRRRIRNDLHEKIVQVLLRPGLEKPVNDCYFESANPRETWQKIRQLHLLAIMTFDFNGMRERIKVLAKKVVETVAVNEAEERKLLERMLSRFRQSFDPSADDIDGSGRTAREAANNLLQVAEVNRLTNQRLLDHNARQSLLKKFDDDVNRRIQTAREIRNETEKLKSEKDDLETSLDVVAALGCAAAIAGGSLAIAGGVAAGAEAVGITATGVRIATGTISAVGTIIAGIAGHAANTLGDNTGRADPPTLTAPSSIAFPPSDEELEVEGGTAEDPLLNTQ